MSRVVAVFVLVLGLAQSNSATDHPCTASAAIQADEDVDHLSDWDHVYRSYQRFSQCDDGSVAEGYSDAIAKLLADKWDSFHRLVALSKGNRRFQRFVLQHINTTVSDDVLHRIARNTRSECPQGAQGLCNLIASAVSRAESDAAATSQ